MSEYLQFFYKHIELSIAFIIILLLILWEEFSRKRLGQSALPPKTVVDLMNHQGAVILDIRDETEFRAGHILHAFNIPASSIQTHLKKLNKHKTTPIVVVSDKTQEINQVIEQLKQNGFQQPNTLSGGISAWKEAGLPLIQSNKR